VEPQEQKEQEGKGTESSLPGDEHPAAGETAMFGSNEGMAADIPHKVHRVTWQDPTVLEELARELDRQDAHLTRLEGELETTPGVDNTRHPDSTSLEELLEEPVDDWNSSQMKSDYFPWFRHEEGISFLRAPIKSKADDYLPDATKPKLLILGTDNRKMNGEDYWSMASLWNHMYAKRHGYLFRMIVPELPPRPWTLDWKYEKLEHCKLGASSNPVPGPGNCTLNNGWTKAKMMLRTMEEYPSIEYFLFLDSDAVISPWYFDEPLTGYIDHLADIHKFDMKNTPVLLNQDAYAAWCEESVSEGHKCINAGTMLFRQDHRAHEFLKAWFKTGVRDYDDQRRRLPFKRGTKKTPMFSGNRYRKSWLGDQMLLVVLATEKPWDQLVIYEPFPEYDAIDSIEGIANYKNTPGLIDEHWTTTYSVRKKADVGLGLPGSGTVSTGMPFWHRFFAQNHGPLIERFARKEGGDDTGNPDLLSEGCQAALKFDQSKAGLAVDDHAAYKEIFRMCPIRPPQPHAYCLSHLPYANCFIQHFCEGPEQKEMMTKLLILKLGDILSCEVVKMLLEKNTGADAATAVAAFCAPQPTLESVESRTRKLLLLLDLVHNEYVQVIKW
jgi:hypothetical protein